MKFITNPNFTAGATESADAASAKTLAALLAAHPESQQVSSPYICAKLGIDEPALLAQCQAAALQVKDDGL